MVAVFIKSQNNGSKINLTNFLIASCQHHGQRRAGNP
jgi:hypothetical protein